MAVLSRVELDEVGPGLLGLADEDGDAEDGVRSGQDCGRPAWRLPREDEPDEIGARLGGDRDVLFAGQATHLDERARDQLLELRGGIGRPHQRRADQDRVRSGELGGGSLGARPDAALGHDDTVAGCGSHELELDAPVDPEGGEQEDGREQGGRGPSDRRRRADGALKTRRHDAGGHVSATRPPRNRGT